MPSDHKCQKARGDYASGVNIVDSLAIHYFAKPEFFDYHPKKELILAALDHIRGCPECQSWLREQVPEEIFTRQEKISKYCCVMMFGAVEEGRTHQINFAMFRGEDPCWKIDGQWSGISFCPWCGQRLPNQPFIPKNEK